ncbi:Terpinolene synthase [Handroanthus impetiginosus]|uniref:Terpinolene synthase n=1 Tax=Handroanthus impetiginosus TaxID=429701 RepID=A0A2G9GE20_9LAMI|nr:Terpinolene synthase [Handroanthus impetiginosus]
MATFVMHMGILYKPNNYLCTFNRKASKQQYSVSSSTVAATALRPCSFKCKAKPCEHDNRTLTRRRSGNYKPALWDFDNIQSLNSEYAEERYSKRASELIAQVKMLLEEEMEDLQLFELIDHLQRLGISYHFEDKINQILNCMYEKNYCKNYETDQEKDLYATALEFRLLRQHGFSISEGEVFECFKNEKGGFKPSLGEDTKGLLQLYEASFMLTQSENTLELAREFAAIFLQKKLDEGINATDDYVALLVRRALELPIHWRVQRPNARWFIDAYGTRPDMNPVVLELAKLDFNIVQAMHQQELKHVSRWWKETGLAESLPFARDRLVECYFWTIGVFQPQYGYSRIITTKVNTLITIIDDIFDVYGTLEELHLFNDAIQRWDMEAMDQLPNYMKLCYLALNNFIHEMAYDVLKEDEFLIIKHLRNSWADLCRTYLEEAKWYSEGYTPKLEEYIENAWISISAPVILSHAFFLVTNPIEKKAAQRLYKYHNIIRCSSIILRLANDLGTSPDEMKRGDVPKSIQCYMNEFSASTEEAQEYVRFFIRKTWKKINEEQTSNSSLSQIFVRSAIDLGRMAQYMYHHGDGHGIQNPTIKQSISSLLFEPIVLP